MEAGLRVHQGGTGEPLLVLLHRLGATGDVWRGWWPLLARRWPGRWLAPDLPGHGGSPALAAYTFDGIAAAVAGIIQPGERTVVLGHSLAAPDMARLLARSQAPVILARGEHDPMNTDEQLARLATATVTLPGLGHNAHVESPQLSIGLLDTHQDPPGTPAGNCP